MRQNFPHRHVRYVTTETFMNEFVDAIRTNTTNTFKRRYRESDVLLIDDIQFIESKEGLQEEFFHTFNDLTGARKQVVITSDRPPKDIPTLEDRSAQPIRRRPAHRRAAPAARNPLRHPAAQGRRWIRWRSPTTCSS